MQPTVRATSAWCCLALSILLPPVLAQQESPSRNPHLAASTWPIYHANTDATACVLATPPVDPVRFEVVDNLTHRRFGRGNVSPWTVLRAPAADGSQVVLTSPVNGVGKYRIEQGRLVPVHFLRLERRPLDFDWGMLVLADGSLLTTERRHDRFVIVGDEGEAQDGPLRVRRRLPVEAERHGRLTPHFTLAHDGVVIALTEKPALIALDLGNGLVRDAIDLAPELGLTTHNSFPIDERGRLHLVGQQAMVAIDWNGRAFQLAWRSDYDMRGPGFAGAHDRSKVRDIVGVARGEPGTGSGTTPSLLGDPRHGLVVVVDGHSPQNHLVAFWRDEIPADWQPLPAPDDPRRRLDRRVAGVIALPHSTPEGDGHSAENSPAVLGNAVVIAQWAGFAPGPNPPCGVQRVDWNEKERRLELVWANAKVHLNGVPTIARGPDGPRVLGMGRDQGRYFYSVLDFANGAVVRRIDLGTDDAVLDQGNNHVVTADGSIVYPGKGQLVRLSAQRAATSLAAPLTAGEHVRTVRVGDLQRRYRVHVPERYDATKPTPVVVVFHGGGGNPESMVRLSGMNTKSDEVGFLAVYPYGSGVDPERGLSFHGGDCCGYAMVRNIDDVGFTRALLDDLAAVANVDADRVFATGLSNGAIMAYRVAAELADRIAAIAPVGGPLMLDACRPSRPVPVLHFHGTADEFAPFQGGFGKGVAGGKGVTDFRSVDATIRAWVTANGCRAEPVITALPDLVDDGMKCTQKTWSGGREGSEVVLIEITGGGHTWPGMPPIVAMLGPATMDVAANDLMWEFFVRHPRPKAR